MGVEEFHWGAVSESISVTNLLPITEAAKMTTKLNHKNGDNTLQEDLLSEKQEKVDPTLALAFLVLCLWWKSL